MKMRGAWRQRSALAWLVMGAVATGSAPPATGQEGATPEVVVPSPIPANVRPTAGDFNGMGRGTMFWYVPGGAVDRRWQGKADRTFAELEPEVVGGDLTPFVGDFDGDGIDDPFFYGSGAGADFLWFGRRDGTFDKTTATV